MRRRRLGKKLVCVVFAVALDLQVLHLSFFDPALPLRPRLVRVEIRTLDSPRLGLKDVLIET
eukprot:5356453-Pleurochrysis_carterae.AAC.2